MSKTIQILVVEDDNDINQLLCNIIRKSGYMAQSAYSGTEAILYIEKQEWDKVLLDLMLPGITGADDYITKPFDIDLDLKLVTVRDTVVTLTAREYEILLL